MSAGAHDAAAPLRAFVEELVRAGVRDAVICPGSRSTPMALALAAHDGLRSTVLLDERSAGFFGLGMARRSGRPTILLSTSGTAAVNFAPAVVEAFQARVPLIVLTADRPAELRDRGAPQTIDQIGLYANHVRWASELSLADDHPDAIAHARSVAGRAVAVARGRPAGPVHLDLPFREPLIPNGELGAWPALPDAPFVDVVAAPRQLDDDDVADLAARIASKPRGLIIAGPMDGETPTDEIVRLAVAAGYPIIADPLSGLRTGRHDRGVVIARGDQLARPGRWIDRHAPDLVIRFGAMPTAKPLLGLLTRSRPELLVIDGDGGWREAALVPATFIHADPARTAEDIAIALARQDADRAASWTDEWRHADQTADTEMRAWLDELDEPFEGAPFDALAAALPDGSTVWAGNSMPVRDLDGWLSSTDRILRIHSNRGANGIDGVVSTALGSAAVVKADAGDAVADATDATEDADAAPTAVGPTVLVVGDVSFLHDLGALVTARITGADLIVIVISNDGGGIFSFLPQAEADTSAVGLPARYEALFGTPHGIDIGPIVAAAGHRHVQVDHQALAAAIAEAIPKPGLTVIELRTDRARNVILHRDVAARVAAALDASGDGSSAVVAS